MLVKNYLAHIVLFNGEIWRNSVVDLRGEVVNIKEFTRETASTIFISGVVAVCNCNLNAEHRKSLRTIVENGGDEMIEKLLFYMKSHNLDLTTKKAAEAIVLPLPRVN